MKVGLTPRPGSNSYTRLLYRVIRLSGYNVNFVSFKKLELFDVIIVSWIENHIFDKKTGGISFFGLCKFLLKLGFIKLISKKTIYVRHNYVPHIAKDYELALRLTNWVESLFDFKIAHSKFANHEIINIPLYISPACNCSTAKDVELTEFDFVVFGRISRYKNLDRLIESWSSMSRLLIIGQCKDQSYKNDLSRISIGKNIRIVDDFYCDHCISSLINGVGTLIINTEDQRAVVSGSYIFGLTSNVKILAKRNDFFSKKVQEGDVNLYMFNDYAELQTLINSGLPDYTYNDQYKRNYSDSYISSKLDQLLKRV